MRSEIDFKAIDEYVTARMRSARIPGLALAIVKGDQVAYSKGYGQADPSGRPVRPQTPFMIGSITKPFTALAVMQLVDAGKVALDAPVQRYLPWFRVADPKASTQTPALAPERSAGASVTVRMLINQTSGLPHGPTLVTWSWPDDENAIEHHVRLVANMKLNFLPGQRFEYSNTNYAALGMIVQAVSGQSYEDYIKQHIFTPLDMQNSFTSQEEAIQHGMAMGYRWWFGFPVPVTLPDNRSNLPAGFLISSAEDMAHFLIAQMNGGHYQDISVLSPDGIALMQAESGSSSHGMGWESIQINGLRLINYTGGAANFQASVFFDPETRIGVFIAANVINALDTLSSAHGTSLLDGITTRNMAESVLSLAMNQPQPNQGVGIQRLSLVFDVLILGLTGALVLSLARIPEWYGQLAQYGIASGSGLAWRSGLIAISHFTWLLLILYLARKVPRWILLVLYQPDLVYWLKAVAATVFLKDLLEIALVWRMFRQTP